MAIPFVAIVDYGLGNLFSVKQACKKVGLKAVITSSRDEILKSSAVILTGVGAFGKAIEILKNKGLEDVLRNYALLGKPVVGICLGMQLLMSESYEFGHYSGLNIIKGKVIRFTMTVQDERVLKVPHVGWNQVKSLHSISDQNSYSGRVDEWEGTLLEGIPDGSQMYFVHSYYAVPAKQELILSKTNYGNNEFCSCLQFGNVTAFQFHPECSGPYGLKIYKNLAEKILK